MSTSPLSGKRILLTRAEHQLVDLADKVRARGAVPINFPCLEVEPLPDEIRQGVKLLEVYGDVLFSSENGVRTVAQFCKEQALDLKTILTGKRIAAVGNHTAASLRSYGIDVHMTPEEPSQRGLIAAYQKHGLPKRLLFFRAEEGRELLTQALREAGVDLHMVAAYRTVCPEEAATDVINMLKVNEVDAVLLGSSKAARHYLQRIGSKELANRPLLAGISQAMAEEAGQFGIDVQIVSERASFDAMLDTLAHYFEVNPS